MRFIRKATTIVAYGAVAMLIGVVATQWYSRNTSSPAPLRHNLIVISLDTLRADRLNAYGYERETAPTINALATEGALFENAVSVTSWTLPAHISMLSGLYPTGHGVTRDNQTKIGPDVPLLSEILQQHGYHTLGFHGGGYVSARYGFSRGFEEYDNTELNKQGGRRIKKKNHGFLNTLGYAQKALLKLEQNENFFLFLHTFDIHCPYNPPEPYYSMFSSPHAEQIKTNKCGDSFFNKISMSTEQVQYVSDRYDGSIRWADENLHGFIDFLKANDLFENTIIVITSDHGEEFWEHGKIGHQSSLHRELIDIPLIIRGPGVSQQRLQEVVSLVDLTPTVLDLLEINIPSEMQGRSLKPLLMGEAVTFPTHRLAELDRHVTLRSFSSSNDHLISNDKEQSVSYYDHQTDPDEEQNVAKQHSETADRLEHEMRATIAALERFAVDTAEPKSKKQIENLKTLGYL